MEAERGQVKASGDVTQSLKDRFARLVIQEGMSRAVGLIASQLMFSGDAWSIDELAQELKLSKASVSISTRQLEQTGLIERVFVPGERKVHFRIAPLAPEKVLSRELATMRLLRELFLEGAQRLPADQQAVRRRLSELAGFYAWISDHISELIAHWVEEHGSTFSDVKEG